MKKTLLVVMAVILSAHAYAQNSQETEQSKWKIGVSAGYTNNSFKMNTSYQADWKQSSRGGVSAGITGQYNFFDWLGVRADLQWIQKNYRNSRELILCDYRYTNDYLQLSVMANFSFGGSRVRGFANVGVYGGYWMASRVNATLKNQLTDKDQDIKQSGLINSQRDNRWVFGYVGGIGIEYRFAKHWAVQAEARYYWDATSQVKQYQRTKDHRYNSTIGAQMAVMYLF